MWKHHSYFDHNSRYCRYDQDWFHRGWRQDGRGSGVEKTTVTVDAGMAVSVTAAADAFGAQSFASVTAELQVLDRGLVSYAFGSVTAIAAASAGGMGGTTAVVDITGADRSIVTTSTITDPSGAASTTVTTFAGIDLKFSLPGLQPNADVNDTLDIAPITSALQGNVASFDVFAFAGGDNTYADVQADALAVEGALSTVTVAAIAAASSTVTYVNFEGSRRADRIDGTTSLDVVLAGSGDDTVDGRDGDDWLFGQDGGDRLAGGNGDDTIFGGNGNDMISGGAGDDWLFGGEGRDTLAGDLGDDLLFGGGGRDSLKGGAGSDILFGGGDDDSVEGEAGSDIFVLGMSGGDGDDSYRGGQGADLYWIVDAFERDVIWDFAPGEGDRLVIDAGMEDEPISMRRAACDADDLEITFGSGRNASVLTLDEFFRYSPDLGSMPRKGLFSTAQVEQILARIETGPDHPLLDDAGADYAFGTMLSLLG